MYIHRRLYACTFPVRSVAVSHGASIVVVAFVERGEGRVKAHARWQTGRVHRVHRFHLVPVVRRPSVQGAAHAGYPRTRVRRGASGHFHLPDVGMRHVS